MRETGVSDRLSQDDESMGQIKQEKRACEARGKLQRFSGYSLSVCCTGGYGSNAIVFSEVLAIIAP